MTKNIWRKTPHPDTTLVHRPRITGQKKPAQMIYTFFTDFLWRQTNFFDWREALTTPNGEIDGPTKVMKFWICPGEYATKLPKHTSFILYIIACQQGGVSSEPPWLRAATRHGPGTLYMLTDHLRGNLTQVQSGEGGSKINIAIDPLILCGHSSKPSWFKTLPMDI